MMRPQSEEAINHKLSATDFSREEPDRGTQVPFRLPSDSGITETRQQADKCHETSKSVDVNNSEKIHHRNGPSPESGNSHLATPVATVNTASAKNSNKAASARNKAVPKLKKAPEAPKRFKSAYILFSAEKHKLIRAQMGATAAKERTSKISKIVAEAWKELPWEEKEKWEALAFNDRTRYEVEKSLYKGPWYVPKTRKQKDSNAPKRPMSAFLAFANSRRADVKRQMPQASNGDVSRALAAMWRQAPDELRQGYINEEVQKRQEYLAAISDWKNQRDDKKRLAQQQREESAEGPLSENEVDEELDDISDIAATDAHNEVTMPVPNYSLSEMHPYQLPFETPCNNGSHQQPLASFFYPTYLDATGADRMSSGCPHRSYHYNGATYYPSSGSFAAQHPSYPQIYQDTSDLTFVPNGSGAYCDNHGHSLDIQVPGYHQFYQQESANNSFESKNVTHDNRNSVLNKSEYVHQRKPP